MVWVDVKGYEGSYVVNSEGEIKSLKRKVKHRDWGRTIPERVLKPNIDKNGYCIVRLYDEGQGRYLKAHRVVAQAFLLNNENKPCVNHKDGNKENNKVGNLEWCTIKENNAHALSTFEINRRKGNDHHLAKDSESKRKIMFTMLRMGVHYRLVAWALDIHPTTLHKWRRLYDH